VHSLYEKADRLSQAVIGAAIEVHRHKGPGLIESIYERCLLRELELRSVPATTQKIVRVEYKGLVFDEPLRFDVLVDDCLLANKKASFPSLSSVPKSSFANEAEQPEENEDFP
jgi:GxxExxY protein